MNFPWLKLFAALFSPFPPHIVLLPIYWISPVAPHACWQTYSPNSCPFHSTLAPHSPSSSQVTKIHRRNATKLPHYAAATCSAVRLLQPLNHRRRLSSRPSGTESLLLICAARAARGAPDARGWGPGGTCQAEWERDEAVEVNRRVHRGVRHITLEQGRSSLQTSSMGGCVMCMWGSLLCGGMPPLEFGRPGGTFLTHVWRGPRKEGREGMQSRRGGMFVWRVMEGSISLLLCEGETFF